MTTDPFDVLRSPTPPVDPDPTFARTLRARLERALLDPREDTMTTTEMTTTEPRQHRAAKSLHLHTLTPYLAVADAGAAVEFYVAAFGAARRGEPIVMPDGRVGHVEVALGDSVLMLADEYPELGLAAPVHRGGVSQSLRLEVPDPDAVVARAVEAGGVLERAVTDSPYGRGGVVLDPSGHRWMISREVAAGPRPGDVGYAALWTRDVAVAERFYGEVLGWTTAAGSGPQGRQVTGLRTPMGLWGGQERPTVFLCYAVADVDESVVLVRAAGGTAGEARDEPYGRIADCVDDQGLPFAVFAPPALATAPPPQPAGPGELDYVELRVPDATRARAFYNTVLGWRFRPGSQPGYWHTDVSGTPPMPLTGLVGGHAEAVAVPWFLVTDLDAAVAAVRAAGGQATEPARTDHDSTADCLDNQGGPFRARARK